MRSEAGAFRLEVGVFPVRRLAFASQTQYHDGSLNLERAALREAIAEPRAIADLEVHLAHPGESCRIVHVLDAVAPMVKIQGRSTVYPGFLGPAIPAGSGRNHRLRGAAILVCCGPRFRRRRWRASRTSGVCDPAGPFAWLEGEVCALRGVLPRRGTRG
ncbi:MAG: hypothetical protein HYZ81_12400 [Nitrospinae bacterium]|nr:hypothetical protein [Nitrospinota bacterium]